MNKHLIKDLNRYADMLAEGELVSPDDLNCSAIMRLAAEALAQAEQEPVARVQFVRGLWDVTLLTAVTKLDKSTIHSLYTAQPQRKPLTDEQIAHATAPIFMGGNPSLTGIARAIEAAHGIKGDA